MNLNDLKKSLAMEIFDMTKEEAISKNICINCKQPPVFNTLLGQKEYQISGLCEPCFDEITTPIEERDDPRFSVQ